MSTQKYIECSHCNREIDVSDVARDKLGSDYFYDGAVIEIVCDTCNKSTEVEVEINIFYEAVQE